MNYEELVSDVERQLKQKAVPSERSYAGMQDRVVRLEAEVETLKTLLQPALKSAIDNTTLESVAADKAASEFAETFKEAMKAGAFSVEPQRGGYRPKRIGGFY